MTFLDSNIILRYLINDDPRKAKRCDALLQNIAQGKEAAWTHALAIAEIIWVLTGTYRLPKERVIDALVSLLGMKDLLLEDKHRVLSALATYRSTSIDFIDAYHAQMMHDRGLTSIYSYDTDFDKLPAVKRMEP